MDTIISRAEAKSLGLKRYFTGKICKNGHTEERMVSSGGCIKCKKSRTLEWMQNNPEKCRNQKKLWVIKNPEKAQSYSDRWRLENREKNREKHNLYRSNNQEKERARHAKWYSQNLEKMREINARWYVENRGIAKARSARRRARKISSMPSWDADLTDFAMAEASDLARRREIVTGFVWHVDHMIPMQARNVCGLHVWSNLQVIPERTNLRKNNRMILTRPGEWISHV